MRCGFDRWSIHKSIRVRRKAFRAIRLLAYSRGLSFIVKKNISHSLTQTVASSCVLHFSIGCYDCRRTSRRRQGIHFSRIRVHFADHVHRRSGVYNKFSFLRFKSWWRRQAPIFRRWKECCFVFPPFFLGNFWPTFTRCFAVRSCHSVSSWDRSSHFRALGLRWGSPGQIIPSDGFWSRNVSMTYDGFCELNTSDWFPYVWALPHNRWRLRRLHILKYTTQLSCSFQHSHCTFVTILFRLFARLFINLAMRIRALSTSLHPFSDL